MRDHIKHGRVTTSTEISLPAIDLITAAATYAMKNANNLSEILRVAGMDVVMLFPSLVLFSHEKGACNTQVRAEVKGSSALGSGEPRVTGGPCQSFQSGEAILVWDFGKAFILAESQSPYP
jgi:hypothetical protein